ncbi:hypothetical protein DFP73DRAFT_286910 [Morchella snyderi]|nr:hypothetical protein DFP73DRAFT_286910 [Morchella snyderi]
MCHKRVCVCIKFSAVLASCFASFSPPPVVLKTGHLPLFITFFFLPFHLLPIFSFLHCHQNSVSIYPVNGGKEHELTICSRYKVAEN